MRLHILSRFLGPVACQHIILEHNNHADHADLASASLQSAVLQLACLRHSKAQAIVTANDCRCDIKQLTESAEPGECHLLNFGISKPQAEPS